MFVEQTRKRNRELVDAAFYFHQSGQLLPDSYLIDVDAFCENGKKILAEEMCIRDRKMCARRKLEE